MSAQEANKILVEAGIVLQMQRPSFKVEGEMRPFKVLSKRGLQYGINARNPVHPAETIIQWDVNEFHWIAALLSGDLMEKSAKG